MPAKELYESLECYLGQQENVCLIKTVYCNVLDLWDQVKGTKKGKLKAEKDWIAREGTILNKSENKSISIVDATQNYKELAQKYLALKFQYIFLNFFSCTLPFFCYHFSRSPV